MILAKTTAMTRIAVAACALALWLGLNAPAGAAHLPWETMHIETARGIFTLRVEIADTPEGRASGLQHRAALAENAGMLFDFQVSRPVAMWMKNTRISLDMVFVDCAGRVLNFMTDTEPYSLAPIRSAGPARAVLEVVAGTVERLGIDANSRIRHRIFDPSAEACLAIE